MSDIQLPHGLRRVEIHTEQFNDLHRVFIKPLFVDQPEFRFRQRAGEYVFHDRHARNELALLIYNADSRGNGLLRALELGFCPVQQNLPVVGLLVAAHDFEQRALTRAV